MLEGLLKELPLQKQFANFFLNSWKHFFSPLPVSNSVYFSFRYVTHFHAMDFDEERLFDSWTFCWRSSRQLRSWLDDPNGSLSTQDILWWSLFQWADTAASGLALSCPRTFWKVHQPDHIFLSLFFIPFSFIIHCKLNLSPKRQNNLSRHSTGNAALAAMSTMAILPVHSSLLLAFFLSSSKTLWQKQSSVCSVHKAANDPDSLWFM